MTEFERDLDALINRHSLENESNTPDFILAQYLVGCLKVFAMAVNDREKWYGRTPPAYMVKDSRDGVENTTDPEEEYPSPMYKEKIWMCKIGGPAGDIPDDADAPMRQAVEQAYREITGIDAKFTFSGWDGHLDEIERRVVDFDSDGKPRNTQG